MLQEKNILVDVSAKTKEEVFAAIAQLSVANEYATSYDAVFAGLQEREKESTTGMMDGFAIPHAKKHEIIQAGIFIFKLKEGVEWASLDGKKIHFVIALLIPAVEANTTHLKLLSQVARLLMKAEIKQQLKNAQTKAEIVQIIQANIN